MDNLPELLEGEEILDLAREVIQGFSDAGLTLATCESLTAGALSSALACVPGASAVLRGALVTYATDLKGSLAGVDVDLLARRGPVDAGVALQMAEGAARRCGADIGLSTTGVAGPDALDGVPPGTVWIGLSGRESLVLNVDAGRDGVRKASVIAGLRRALEALEAHREAS